uniref:Uncharacterized protein n=1 Tax=Rhodosorus marinus TaxID=101924 RepID=A0A7S3A6L7_9RHOD|mmetsp:Transcript_5314/g.22558  ORF Transcript_5314/g.22558 Transcript_5314/m.22558 type:complete len:115 (+) Transcript_5314:315-659(+)
MVSFLFPFFSAKTTLKPSVERRCFRICWIWCFQSCPASLDVEKIELLAVGRRAVRRGELDAVILNASGQRGSIAVYNALFQKYKLINKQAAQEVRFAVALYVATDRPTEPCGFS